MQFHRVPELLVGHSLVDGSQFGFILAVISVLRLHSSLQLSFQRQEINHIPLRHSHSWRGPRGAETADPRWAEDRKLKLTGGSNNTCYFETQIKNLDYWSNMVVFWWKCSFLGLWSAEKNLKSVCSLIACDLESGFQYIWSWSMPIVWLIIKLEGF